MVLFMFYNEDGDEIDGVWFNAEELAEEFDSITYTWQDLDELGYRLLGEYSNAETFSWEYLGGEEN